MSQVNNPTEFESFSMPVLVYGNLEKYSDTISKARVRIFYRGLNRNSTYISDEFAEKLISTLSYAPIKGIYDEEAEDFTDHGNSRTLGRAYGFVPNPSNFSWEKHVDEDGVEREYACADVLLWTGLYEEAKKIPGKSQSMELYSKTIKGEWRNIDGQKCYYFTDGCFLGLQALGDSVEPCFEGSEFYSLLTSIYSLKQDFEQFKEIFSLKEKKGDNKMINFKLSDGAKHEKLFDLLNPNYTEEGNWEVEYCVLDVYDEYAVAFNYGEKSYERIYYSKDDENDSVTISKKKRCYIIDVTEEEKAALDSLKTMNDGTYENITEKFDSIQNLETQNQENISKIEELNNSLSSLNEEKAAKEQEFANLQTELNSLKEYKKAIETTEKNNVIEKYSVKLEDEIINKYKEALETYTVTDLEKELSYELVNSDPDIFSKKPGEVIPKDNSGANGIEDLLSKYM